MNDYWNGRAAIITGATHGIGLRLAERLSAKGVRISTIYRDNDDQANNLKKIIDNNGSELFIVKGDITDKNNIKTLIEETINKWNRIDFLINNIGIDVKSEIYNLSEEEWIKSQEIMLNVPFRTIKLCLPVMRKQQFGRIINMGASSRNYMKGQAGLSAFGINKAALYILTQTLALEEIKNGITSNMVAPGSTSESGVNKEEDRIPISQIPIGRRINRDEVTDGIMFFLSENANSITGQFLGINGGCSV
jgi:3-oxoacyl-[acyl-carrier protein] reductase